ncbi:hypothetical protein PHLGIDRAFT_442875 [Phlebiopsis gigantea 11061_1 CR5-6]|uniref:F-box domain-containing protein n=1 Tax=Phlebiopsis gigantea (strain 11061_1 CR5-6) TaxID=745531 RepID=A0A0C3NP53_PHLG1|nr:hypothetical protein PHLGIDRAFT_442875 [Phlebiopsis gigantea 11061_1 CR5-6]
MSLGDAQLPAARFAELRRAVMALTGSISSHADNMGRLGDISFSSSGGMLPSDLRDIYDEELRAVRLMYLEYLQGGKDFRAVLAKLSAQRNDHAPVNKLPTEVLCMVFTIHRDSDGVHEHPDLPGHPIVPISQTCARWRRICLSTPKLWCKVRLSSRWAKLALDRSGSYPLNLSHDFLDGEGSVELLDRLGGHLSRVECLLLNNSRLDRVRAVFEAPPAPNLKQLSMEILSPNVPLYSAPCVLDGQPFKGETPKLRHLELNFFRMPWSRGYYQNLTTLKIARCAAGRGSLKDKDICCILQDMPDLQELELALERRCHSQVSSHCQT